MKTVSNLIFADMRHHGRSLIGVCVGLTVATMSVGSDPSKKWSALAERAIVSSALGALDDQPVAAAMPQLLLPHEPTQEFQHERRRGLLEVMPAEGTIRVLTAHTDRVAQTIGRRIALLAS